MPRTTPEIRSVKARAIVVPLKRLLKNAFGVFEAAPLVLIDVATDQGDGNSADDQFAAALQPQCRNERDWETRRKKDENGGKALTPAQKQEVEGRYQYCMTNPRTAGFYQTAEDAGEKKPQIWIHRNRETATTRLHESLHAYANPDVARKLPHFASEGMTEYFTRQIALRKNLAISPSYDGPFNAIQEFSARFGEDTLKQVYFQGQLSLICKNLVERFGEERLTSVDQFESIAYGLALIGRTPDPERWTIAASLPDGVGA